MCHMQLLQKRTHSGQCVSEFLIFFLQRYTSSYMYMYLHTIMKHQRKHCMVSNEKKNALHVGYYWLWKKIDVTDFFLIFKNCCMFHVPSYFWSKNSWSPKEYRQYNFVSLICQIIYLRFVLCLFIAQFSCATYEFFHFHFI